MKKALCREDPEGGLLRRWGALLCVRRGILPHEAEWKDSLIHFAGGALFCASVAGLWRRRSNASRNMPAAISQSPALASPPDSGIALQPQRRIPAGQRVDSRSGRQRGGAGAPNGGVPAVRRFP